MWLSRTIFEMVWTITPISFLGLTFHIAYNDNTKKDRAKKRRRGVGDGNQAQHMTRHKKLSNMPYCMNMFE